MTIHEPVDALNVAVTKSIGLAESLEDERKLSEAAEAYATVSEHEEALAALLPADDLEGAVARVGAVTAALRSGQMPRALALAARFKADVLLTDARRREIDAAFALLAPQVARPRATSDSLLSQWRSEVRMLYQDAA